MPQEIYEVLRYIFPGSRNVILTGMAAFNFRGARAPGGVCVLVLSKKPPKFAGAKDPLGRIGSHPPEEGTTGTHFVLRNQVFEVSQ